MKYPAYPQYKDSGVAWLGEVPEHWEVRRLKYLASINDSALPESTDADFEFSYIDIGSVNLVDGITATESMAFENAPSRARRVVQAGDIIVSTVRTYLRAIASIPQSEETLIVSTGFAVIRPRRIESKFLNYALKESSFVENVVSRSVGVSYPAVNASEIGDIKILAPSETEQIAIANFLDSETGRIDTLVAKKRKLMELLKEKRSALISRTVTCGLPAEAAREVGLTTGNSAIQERPGQYDGMGDFNRPKTEANKFAPTSDPAPSQAFKDSGVEWLGKIPVDWVVTNLGFASIKIGSGKTPTGGAETYESDGVMFLRSQNVYDEGLRLDDVVFIAEEVDVEMSSSRVFSNDVLLNITGASIGRTSIVPAEFPPANVNQHVCIIRLKNKVDSHYIAWVMKSSSVKAQIENAQTGAAREGLNFSQISKIKLALPPIAEQTAIATYIDRETTKIDRLMEKVETAIARLQEYRGALITAAVTGKIDVRGTA